MTAFASPNTGAVEPPADVPTGDATLAAALAATLEADAHRLHELSVHLPSAVETGAFHLEYQPQVDLRRGAIVGVEALARWQHPTLGSIPPGEFLGEIAALRLGDRFFRMVLRQACRDAADWAAAGVSNDLAVSVNVSPVQLADPAFADSVATILGEYHVRPERICLEITEGVALHHHPDIRSTLDALRAVGTRVAVDDFGTGHSSLLQFKYLRADVLKVDRSFVRELGRNADDARIVANVIALGAAFGVDVVAEGVEDDLAADVLRGLGCRVAQGFHLGRPMSADAIRELLATPGRRRRRAGWLRRR